MNDVAITNADLFKAIAEVRTEQHKGLDEVKTGMNQVMIHMERIDTRNENADKLHTDHEIRIRGLEKIDYEEFKELKNTVEELKAFRWKLVGISAAISVILSVAGVIIAYLGIL